MREIATFTLNDLVTVPRRPDSVVIEEFNFMLEEANTNGWSSELNCHNNPAEWSDYKQSPSPQRAAEMCAGCPMLTLCREFAVAKHRSWTVLGGIAWVEGRPFQPTAKNLVAISAAA